MNKAEEVARAIKQELMKRRENELWQPYIDGAARAAIEAMREPTDAMEHALDQIPGGWGRGAWINGIDAALNEEG